jgi:hypothetical protein
MLCIYLSCSLPECHSTLHLCARIPHFEEPALMRFMRFLRYEKYPNVTGTVFIVNDSEFLCDRDKALLAAQIEYCYSLQWFQDRDTLVTRRLTSIIGDDNDLPF